MTSTATTYRCQYCGAPIDVDTRHACTAPTPPTTALDRIAALEARLDKVEEWARKGILVSTAEYGISYSSPQTPPASR